jgi:hypothetical protein
MKTIRNIYDLNCAKYCSGKKAIRIVETATVKKAYVQYADGGQVWKYNSKKCHWEMISQVVCNNC